MIKNIVKTIMCVCAASALAACASAPMAHNRPDWTLNAGKHPQCQGVNDFCEFGISAVPLASDEAMAIQSAEDVARAKIAARVQTYSNAINKNFARAITAQGTTEVSKEVQQALETMVNLSLNGVKIIEIWENPAENGNVYAIAKWDKDSLINSLKESKTLSEEVKAEVTQAANSAWDELAAQRKTEK